jgi:hypothetical protein
MPVIHVRNDVVPGGFLQRHAELLRAMAVDEIATGRPHLDSKRRINIAAGHKRLSTSAQPPDTLVKKGCVDRGP